MSRPSVAPLLAVVALGSGCATTTIFPFVDAASLVRPSPEEADGHAAVMLLRRSRVVLDGKGAPNTTEMHRHEAIAILAEEGFGYADVKVAYPEDGKIVGFAGRTIAPDGRVTALEPERVYEATGKDERGFSIRVFALPRVEVGAVIEYRYTVVQRNLRFAHLEYLDGSIPVRRAEIELEGTRNIVAQARTFHTPDTRPWDVSLAGIGWRFSWSIENVAPRRDERWDGHLSHWAPHWAYKIDAFVGTSWRTPIYDGWPDVFDGRALALLDDDKGWSAGWDLELDTSACGDARCLATAAYDQVRARFALRGFQGWPTRTYAAMKASKEGSDAERGRVLLRALRALGLEVQPAFAVRHWGPHWDEEFPRPDAFDHLLLRVSGPGLEPTWVDGGCDVCKLGELTDHLQGADVALLSIYTEPPSRKKKVRVDFEKLVGPEPAPVGSQVVHALALEPDGRVVGEIQRVFEGDDASDARRERRHWSADRHREEAAALARLHWRAARVLGFDRLDTDGPPARAVERVRVELPGLAVRDGAPATGWLLPLDLLRSRWDGPPPEEAEVRPLRIGETMRSVQSVELRLPPGWVVHDRPAPAEQAQGPWLVRLEIGAEADRLRVTRTAILRRGVHEAAHRAGLDAALASIFIAARGQVIAVGPAPGAVAER
jgi:hypothetical protein